MRKVLIHDDENEDIHYIKTLYAKRTLCDQHLNPISTTHVKKFDVTCKECIELTNMEVCL